MSSGLSDCDEALVRLPRSSSQLWWWTVDLFKVLRLHSLTCRCTAFYIHVHRTPNHAQGKTHPPVPQLSIYDASALSISSQTDVIQKLVGLLSSRCSYILAGAERQRPFACQPGKQFGCSAIRPRVGGHFRERRGQSQQVCRRKSVLTSLRSARDHR